MFKQTVYLFVTYTCNGCNFEQFFISVGRIHAQFQRCWHEKELVLCMAIINSNGKKILFIILAMIYIFQNEAYVTIVRLIFLSVEVTKDSFSMKLTQYTTK